MKYLAYFKPNKELSDLILQQENLVLPGAGLHSTILNFYMDPKYEETVISDLLKIDFSEFEIETQEFCDFDNNSLVLRLSCSEELLKLHKEIILSVGDYLDSDSYSSIEKYCWNNYHPHLTISKSSSNFNRTSNELINQRDTISRYFLAKKLDTHWEILKEFIEN